MYNIYTYKSNWWGFVAKRLLIAVVAFFVISCLLFIVTSPYFPSSFPKPIVDYGFMSEEQVTQLRHELHLDTGILGQYFYWLGDFFTGNWGESLYPDSYYSK